MGNPKNKIFNDPIYGFIRVPDKLVFDLIEHPYFQRLRRIKQLGLTHMVYPGALHTRFHHTLGAMHLMGEAIATLRSKGVNITDEEAQAVTIAILLHDIGHGPFSHALESSIVHQMSHENLSELFMERLNEEFGGKLAMAIKVFQNKYPKKFLHQLVSSQLDMDRLDYLKRDSFYTGVSEGVISTERLITMLNMVKDEIVVEVKGIYSVEKFIIARRLMYWQVYLHKTVLAAEYLMVYILKRAKELASKGIDLFGTPALKEFLYNRYTHKDFVKNKNLLDTFAMLDDNDIMTSVKVWCKHPDKVLSTMCQNLINRRLSRIIIQSTPFEDSYIEKIKNKTAKKLGLSNEEVNYLVFSEQVANDVYRPDKIRINILFKDGKTSDISQASDQLNIDVLAKTVKKHFLCFPKEISL